MNINMKKKIVKKVKEVVTSTPIVSTVSLPKIGKLELFGNEDMHKVVNKINEIIDAL
jgi:hypothetical protein